MTTSSDIATATASAYTNAIANQRTSLAEVALALDPTTCEASGKALKGRVVVVTGAGSGFGRAFALKAASYGAKVVLSDVNVPSIVAIVTAIQASGGTASAFPTKCDTSDWDHQVAMFKHARATYGHIDVVVPNAGIGETGEWLKDIENEAGDPVKPSFATINVNLIGAAYTTKLGFFHLRQNPSQNKSIVFIGSMSSFSGIPQGPMYTMAKHGIIGLFRSVYFNGQSDRINTNVICPWFTDTGIIAPMTRVGILGLPLCKVDDVVAAMIHSAGAKGFTGNMLSIDAQGICSIPYEAYGVGETGYYKEFERRAVLSIKVDRIVKDIGLVVKQSVQYWMKGVKGRAAVLGLLFVLMRLSWRRRAGP